jgi:hypothetical protein
LRCATFSLAIFQICELRRRKGYPWLRLCSSPIRFTKSDYQPLPSGDLLETKPTTSTVLHFKSKIPRVATINWPPDGFGEPIPVHSNFTAFEHLATNAPYNSIPINCRPPTTTKLPKPTTTTANMEGQFTTDENLEWLELFLAQNQTPQTGDIATMFPHIDFYTEQQPFNNATETMFFDMPQEQSEPTAVDLDELWRQIFGEAQQTPDPLSFPPTQPDTPIFEELLLPTPPSEFATEENTPTSPPGWGFSAIQFVDCHRGSSQQPPRLAPLPPPPPPVDESPPSPLKKGNKYGRGGRLRCQKCRDQHGECIFDPADLSKPCRRCEKSRTKCPCIKTFGPKKEERRRTGGR